MTRRRWDILPALQFTFTLILLDTLQQQGPRDAHTHRDVCGAAHLDMLMEPRVGLVLSGALGSKGKGTAGGGRRSLRVFVYAGPVEMRQRS